MLLYVPFSIGMLYKMSQGSVKNVNPRKVADMLAATSPFMARVLNAEKNMYEGFMLFAPAVVAAVTSGVETELVGVYMIFWMLARLAFIFLYCMGTELLSMFRSFAFAFSLATSCKLLFLAAAASAK